MKLRFLGTGTSFGVPVVGCGCGTCTSDDPRDRRTRSGALVELPEGTLLIDAPPELRLQLIDAGTSRVDAVWITHTHADHVHGLDDLRIFSLKSRRALPVHVSAPHGAELKARFSYVFDDGVQPPKGTSKPHLELVSFAPHEPVHLLGTTVHPVEVPHGPATVYGLRAGDLGFVTDAKELPPAAMAALAGVRVLVLNALWFGNPHPTHLNVEEAVEVARTVGAERTFLTHLTHRVRHAELSAWLPSGIAPAYDGLVVEV